MKYESEKIVRPKPIKKNKAEKLPIPKGPRDKKFIGNFFDFAFHGPKFLMNLQKEYGNAASFYINKELYIVLFDPDLVNSVYTSQQKFFLKGIPFLKMKRTLGEGILTTDQPIHLNHRRMMQPSFHKEKIEKYCEIFFLESNKKIEEILEKEIVDLYEEMEDLSFLMIAQCLFGSDFKQYKSKIIKNMAVGSKKSVALSLLPSFFSSPYIPLKWLRDYHKSADILINISKKIIEERKKQNEEKDDLLQLLLSSTNENLQTLSEKEVQNEILSSLLAGSDTTSILLTTSLVWLYLNPKTYKKIKNELLNEKWVNENRPPTIEEIYKESMVDNVIRETLRISSPAWMISRQAKEDLWLENVFIPKGSHVIVSQYVSHRNPKYFDSPFSWKPERWNNNFEKTLPKGVFYPFGGGSRKCIGENLAWVEAKIALSLIINKTSWKSLSKSRVFPKISHYVTAVPSEKVMFSFSSVL
jgi:cytochrome P450